MSRDNASNVVVFEHNSAGGDLDTSVKLFAHERPILVTAVGFIGVNPSDTDADTTAVDVSYDPNTLDVEIAALAAAEFNDTDNDIGTLLTRVDIALTAASLATGTTGVRVPAGLVVAVTMTNTGAGADTRYFVVVEYIVL